MKMTQDDAAGLNLIRAYQPGKLTIRDKDYQQSLLVFPTHIHTDWPFPSVQALSKHSWRALTDYGAEILVLGTGEFQVFPDPRIFIPLMDMQIGYEIMDNAAACRTYNILLSEGRKAVLGLILEDPNQTLT